MSPKPKKSFIILLLIIQLAIGLFSPIAQGADPASTQATKPTGPNTTKFEVTKYLSASGQSQSYLKNSNPIASFIVQGINFLVLTIGSLCFLSIVIGGFTLVVSNGNENLVNKGKEIIKFALIGLVIVLFAYLIVAFVQSLFYELPGK